MSQNNIDQGQAAEPPSQEAWTFIRQVRAATRRKYVPEDKIRIVLEEFRREVTVSDLCRREGLKPSVFYAWTEVPGDLEVATLGFADYYNHRRYHKTLSNVTPNDFFMGRREEILIRRREVKARTLRWRQPYNRQRRRSYNTATSPCYLLNKRVPLLLLANTWHQAGKG